MNSLSRSLFYSLYIISFVTFLISVEIALISMLAVCVINLIILVLKRNQNEAQSKLPHWFAWSIHGLVLIAVYMAYFGVANIVGSGRKHSARMAVSTLRTLHWAERQCIPKLGRVCTIGELKGEVKNDQFNTTLLRHDFKRVIDQKSQKEYGRLGQYYILVDNHQDQGRWLAYTWPVNDPTLQAFCIDQDEEIMELPISKESGAHYLGLENAPKIDACLGSLHINPNPPQTQAQLEAIAQGKKPPPHTHLGEDQKEWQRWRGRRTRISKSRK